MSAHWDSNILEKSMLSPKIMAAWELEMHFSIYFIRAQQLSLSLRFRRYGTGLGLEEIKNLIYCICMCPMAPLSHSPFQNAFTPFSIIYSMPRRSLPHDTSAKNHGQANNPSKIHLLRCVQIKSNNGKV